MKREDAGGDYTLASSLTDRRPFMGAGTGLPIGFFGYSELNP
jgi:hypothetical protein